MLNDIEDLFKKKQCAFGIFMKTGDPAFVEIAGLSGFEFVILDMEHGPVDFLNLQNLIRAAECAGVLPVVRVSALDATCVSRALDVGAKAVQVPMIETAEEARLAVNFAKYAPEGARGVCRYVRAAGYSSKDRFEYFREANSSLVILQLEGEEGVRNIDAILETPGVDVIFVGPYDLSQSLGVPGQTEHPIVEEKIRFIVEKASKKNIVVGTFVDDAGQAKKWMEAGVQYIACSVDTGIFYQACKQLRGSFNIEK